MVKTVLFRSLYRSLSRRYAATTSAVNHHSLRQLHFSLPHFSTSPRNYVPEWRHPFTMGMGSTRSFSEDLTHMPDIKDPEVKCAFNDLMDKSWDELPHTVIHEVKEVFSKNIDDKVGLEALDNAFRAAEAVEEFIMILTSLKMEIDDAIGLSGENVKPLPQELSDALHTVSQRYATYLDAFGPEEGYLKKKVEMELGTKIIHLKTMNGER